SKKTDKAVFPKALRLISDAIAVDRRPILCRSIGALFVVVAKMMVHVIMVVEDVRHTQCEGLHNAIGPIQQATGEIRIMDKVVRNALEIPAIGPHDRNKRGYYDPPGQAIEKKESPKDKRDNADAAKGWNCIKRGIAEEGMKPEHRGLLSERKAGFA